MHRIQEVAVEGFWDDHNFKLALFEEVTFLIGQNGTGKSTLINLVAAALTGDVRTLAKTPFRRIVITLDASLDNFIPKITVSKIRRRDRPSESIEYRIASGSKDGDNTDFKLQLDDLAEESSHRFVVSWSSPGVSYRRIPTRISDQLRSLVQVNWLSVHRTPISDRIREDRIFESAIDSRLEGLFNELVRYFSTLSQQKDDEVRQFQESIFVSLVENQETGSFFETSELSNLDTIFSGLSGIFSELHVKNDSSQNLLDEFQARGRNMEKKLKRSKKNDTFMLDDAIYLLGLRRVSSVVSKWNELQARVSKIFSPRDKYITTVNNLLQRKRAEITASNELKFTSRSGKFLKSEVLSSGEKQLLILLTETLLQREAPTIFIADEPELSLHVLWQEKIIASLRLLNPNAQIIAATHSPDIVGVLANRIVDMETLIP